MKIYRRYIAREVVGGVLLVLLAFLALFAFFDMLGEINNVGQGGYRLHHAFGFVLLRVPGRVYELMPIAVLIGTLYALSSLTRSTPCLPWPDIPRSPSCGFPGCRRWPCCSDCSRWRALSPWRLS